MVIIVWISEFELIIVVFCVGFGFKILRRENQLQWFMVDKLLYSPKNQLQSPESVIHTVCYGGYSDTI